MALRDTGEGGGHLGTGPYDTLYRSRDKLWPDRPGRMVRRAAEIRRPGRALDVGCGDGKDVYYLERMGWIVDGVDVSMIAIDAARRRLRGLDRTQRGSLTVADAVEADFGTQVYDLAIVYGIYHCLDDEKLVRAHETICRAVKCGGLLAFATFNNGLPLPPGHHTNGIVLRPPDYIPGLLSRWRCLALESGDIVEEHLPLVPRHHHSLTWGLFEKT